MAQLADPIPVSTASVPARPYVALCYPELNPEGTERDWLWHGYLLPGGVTLLTSLWKSGKSTLLTVLLARLKTGGTLGGLPLRAGRAVVISEEPRQLWWDRGRQLPLDGHVHWFCQPFKGKPTAGQWTDLLDEVGRMHDRQAVNLLAIDSLANLGPMRSENDSVEMTRALTPLQRLTGRGVSVLIAHHPRKREVLPGQAARGSGALCGFVDILLEMQAVCRRNPKDRRRRLRAWSRYPATPANWVVEWTADGSDYLGLGPSAEPDFERGWPILRALLEAAEKPLTRKDILRAWPDSAAAPSDQRLWKWLTQVVKEGHVLHEGSKNRREPHRYYLPGTLAKVQANLLAELNRRLGGDAP